MQIKKNVNWPHYVVNMGVLVGAVICFFLKFANLKSLFEVKSNYVYLLLIFTVVLVQSIKVLRLFLIFYGQGLPLKEHLSIYCKVTAVNIVFPFKLGELFRVYCYGEKLNNYYIALVGILLDRAVDTVAMLVFIVLECISTGQLLNRVFCWLFLFLGIIFSVYLVFPKMHTFWNKYFLTQRTSEHKLWGLKVLKQLKLAYSKVKNIMHGRGIMLILLSLLAWGMEFVCVMRLANWGGHRSEDSSFYAYLSGAITDVQQEIFLQVVFFTAILLAFVYTCLKLIKFCKRR